MRSFQSAAILRLPDWFIPEALKNDATAYRRARMYLVPHLCGAPLGLVLALYLYAVDPNAGAGFWLAIAVLLALYIYPFLLRRTGRLTLLAPISVQHSAFIILFASYLYGGVSSPFIVWLPLVPLAGVFYLRDHPRRRLISLALIAAQILVFYALHALGYGLPEHMSAQELATFSVLSAVCACLLAVVLSLSYTRIVTAQQTELEREVANHRATEAKLRLAKEDAERADRAKSTFLANTSHELRTPLNAIIGFAEVIRSETFGPIDNPRYLEYLKDIHDSGRHLLRIINDILDLSKIEAGKATLDRQERVELGPAIEAAARMVQPQAEAESITISLDIAGGLPIVTGSGRMLQQVFINLLTNAVKFTPAGGTVSVRAAPAGSRTIAIEIRDTGIGMSEDDIALALTAFGQVDSDMARKYAGTGLGLPLAKAIVELHGGTLVIDSHPGRGTTVIITLPHDGELRGGGQPTPAAALDAR